MSGPVLSGLFLGRVPVSAFVTGEVKRGARLCVQVAGLAGYKIVFFMSLHMAYAPRWILQAKA